MKNIGMTVYCFAALSCVTTEVMAKEIPIGAIEVGGGTSLSLGSRTITYSTTGAPNFDTDEKATTLNARALYYIAPNIGVGMLWDYDKQKFSSKSEGLSETKTSNLWGLAAAYNVSVSEQLSVRPRLFFGNISQKNVRYEDGVGSFGSYSVNYSGTSWGLGMDLSYFTSDNVSFDAGVVYKSASLRASSIDTNADFTSLIYGVGVTAYLR